MNITQARKIYSAYSYTKEFKPLNFAFINAIHIVFSGNQILYLTYSQFFCSFFSQMTAV